MLIYGIMKLTLLDFPQHVACTVFTGGCNMRCPFCHNALLVKKSGIAIDEDEVFAFLKKRSGVLDGVCISGGEPLLQPDIEPFLERVRAMGYQIKLDTNGMLPKALKSLVNKKLVDYVAMDIKNSPSEYSKTVGIANFDISPVKESVDFLISGSVDYEFRTTVVSPLHTRESIIGAAQMIQGAKRYFLQSFVESDNLLGGIELSAFSKTQMEAFVKAAEPYVQTAALRGI